MEVNIIGCDACDSDHQALEATQIEGTELFLVDCPETGEVIVYDPELGDNFLLEEE